MMVRQCVANSHKKHAAARRAADPAQRGIVRSLDRGLRLLRAIGRQGAEPAALAAATGIDREWLVEGNILSMDAGIVRAGIADDDERSRHALRHHSVQARTPETANSTHYFWALPRNYALDDANITKILHEQVSRAFEEDRTMIEAQARNIARFGRFETGAGELAGRLQRLRVA